MCLELDGSDFVVDFCDYIDPQLWATDSHHRLRDISDPSLCVTVDHAGKPWQRPEDWSRLGLEPCGDRADQMWDLPGMWSWIFIDGFEGGDVTMWSP